MADHELELIGEKESERVTDGYQIIKRACRCHNPNIVPPFNPLNIAQAEPCTQLA